MRANLYFLAFLLLIVAPAGAQQYLFARYTPRDGLINNRARFLYQDSKGRIYVSTFGGLSVYDGARFTNYTTENGLATSLINDVVEMGDDSLWIVPNGQALHCMVHGVIRNIKTADNYFPVVNQLVRCSDGYLYAIADQGLFRFENNRFIHLPLKTDSGKEINPLLQQAVEQNGRLLIVTDPNLGAFPDLGTVVAYDLHTHRTILSGKGPKFNYLLRTATNEVFAATTEGVRRLDLAALAIDEIRLKPMPRPFAAADSLISGYLYMDNYRNLWVSTGPALIKIGAGGERQSFTPTNGMPAGFTTSILQDKEGNMWFANDRNGITRLDQRQVEYFSQPRPGFTVKDLSANPANDSVWFLDQEKKELLLINGDRQQLFHSIAAIPSNAHLLIGKKAWLISGDGMYELHFPPGRGSGGADRQFRASLFYRDSALLYTWGIFDRKGNPLFVSDKLSIWINGRLIQRSLPYRSDEVAVDKYNRYWIITRSNVLQVYDLVTADTGMSLRLLASWSHELPRTGPRSIAVDNEGHVWIGTRDHGLYCLFFDNLHLQSIGHLTTENGLPENFVNYLQSDDDNTVWACTPAGLDRIRLENGRFMIDNFTYSHENYQNVFRIQSSRQGMHWALVKEGYMKILSSPREGPVSKTGRYLPQVLFSQVLVDNQLVADTTRKLLSLPYDRNNLSFYVGVTSFINETQTRYSYFLEGSSHPVWSPLSGQSAINFVNLPPGKYTLRVKARFLSGSYPDQLAGYEFVIRPPWWLTGWFWVAVTIGLIGLTLAAIRLYTRRRLEIQRIVLEKKQAIERERTRIATDMHDDLGAGLSRIKFLSETIGIKKQQQLPIEEEISGIREYSHDMIDKMGEIVWALNEKNDSLSDLLSYTRSYAAEYLLQAGIRCTIEIPDDPPFRFVSGEFRRNVYLTIKEALHNIVKHAQAENVCIHIGVGSDLVITLRDDGIGFDPACIRPFRNGLYNMQKRVRDIGGILTIGSGGADGADQRSAGGTLLRLSAPL